MTARDDYKVYRTATVNGSVMLDEQYDKAMDEIDRLRKFETDALGEIDSLNAELAFLRQDVRGQW